MNRAERRRADRDKGKKTATYNLSEDQIQEIKKKAVDEAVDTAFILMLALPVMVLHDKYAKLMKKDTRLINFMDEILELYDSYNKGYFTIEDLVNTIYEETGVKIDVSKK